MDEGDKTFPWILIFLMETYFFFFLHVHTSSNTYREHNIHVYKIIIHLNKQTYSEHVHYLKSDWVKWHETVIHIIIIHWINTALLTKIKKVPQPKKKPLKNPTDKIHQKTNK